MSFTAVIITNVTGDQLANSIPFTFYEDREWTYTLGENFITYWESSGPWHDKPLATIIKNINSPKVFIIDSNSFVLFKRFVAAIHERISLIIYNDDEGFYTKEDVASMVDLNSFLPAQ